MPIDFPAAAAFMATHARTLDRRRFDLRFDGADPDGVLAALDAYRNADGGYGWGLEPDLRAPESQPGGAFHAFETFSDAAPATSPRAVELCDWLAAVSLPDGGLPFAFPVSQSAGTAPWWLAADPAVSSLHITAAVAGRAHAVARHDAAVAGHPWLARATRFCLDAAAAPGRPASTLELLFGLELLDAIAGDEPAAVPLLERFAASIPAGGALRVQGGAEDEYVRPLDFAPFPGRPVRERLAPGVVAADLERLAGGQHADGGWDIDHVPHSTAARVEWRGYVTLRNLTILQANGLARTPAG
jgi:hypothetical protein